MQYRRANTSGACYFFTVNLAERNKILLIDHVDELRAAFKKIKQNYPFTINAMVVLPDHLHTLWHLPDNDADFPTRWRLIKSIFSHALPQTERISTSRRKKENEGSGNVAIGNTSSRTIKTLKGMSIIFITIR
jgi:putative transposase